MSKIVWDKNDYHCDVAESIFAILTKHYALSRVKICFEDDYDIILEKYNVVGWKDKANIFNVYDTAFLDDKLCSFDVNDVICILELD